MTEACTTSSSTIFTTTHHHGDSAQAYIHTALIYPSSHHIIESLCLAICRQSLQFLCLPRYYLPIVSTSLIIVLIPFAHRHHLIHQDGGQLDALIQTNPFLPESATSHPQTA